MSLSGKLLRSIKARGTLAWRLFVSGLRAVGVSVLRTLEFLRKYWLVLSGLGVVIIITVAAAPTKSQIIVGPFEGLEEREARKFGEILRRRLYKIANNQLDAYSWSSDFAQATIVGDLERVPIEFFDHSSFPIQYSLPVRSLKEVWRREDRQFSGQLIESPDGGYIVEIVTGSASHQNVPLRSVRSDNIDQLGELAAWSILGEVAPLELALYLKSLAPLRALDALRSIQPTHPRYGAAQALVATWKNPLATGSVALLPNERQQSVDRAISSDDRLSGLLAEAVLMYRSGRREQGIARLEELSEQFSTDPRPRYIMIDLKAHFGDLDGAKTEATAGIGLDAGDERIVSVTLAETIRRNSGPEAAIEYLDEHVSPGVFETFWPLLTTRGTAYAQIGELARAELDYKNALELSDADDGGILDRWGMVERIEKGCDAALVKWREAEEIGYVSAEMSLRMGSCYQEKGDLERAAKLYEKAATYDPKNIWAYNNAGFMYRNLGFPKRAIAQFEAGYAVAADADAHLPMLYLNWARALVDLEMYEEVIELLDPVVDVISNDTLVILAFAAGRAGDVARAERAFNLNRARPEKIESAGLARLYNSLAEQGIGFASSINWVAPVRAEGQEGTR